MSQYSLIAFVLFVMVAAIVMAFCQREEMEADKSLSRYGFKVSYVRNWFVFVVCVVLISLSVGTSASAGQHDPEWNPPTRYDHTYSGDLRVHRVPVQEISKTCQRLYSHYGIKTGGAFPNHGCSSGNRGGICEVVIPLGSIQKATPAAILRHETGHCNGWSGKHEE